MSSIAHLIGLDSKSPLGTATAALNATSAVNPDHLPALASGAKLLDSDLRSAYLDALAATERTEKEQDRTFLERAREFVELDDQVQQSTHLLSELSSFLSVFQRDLSAVSGHISELQGRSKTIEARLQARKAVEHSLHPFIASITISPALISTIVDSDPASNTTAWIPAVRELDAKLGAIRGGARVESRKTLDEAAEGLRVAASSKILTHLISLLRPFTLSVSPSLPSLHASLLSLKPLFDFLRRHAARQAHEFQKAYTQTMRWYYETGFRRYVRALEKVRTKAAAGQVELIGAVGGGGDSLALLNQRRKSLAPSPNPNSPSLSSSISCPSLSALAGGAGASAAQSALENSLIDGAAGVILAHEANDKNMKPPPPESLFRSISLVLASNSSSEYTFLSTFFGQHSTLDLPPSRSATPLPLLHGAESTSGGTTTRGSSVVDEGVNGLGTAQPQSESGRTIGPEREAEREREMKEKEGRTARVVVDGLWKTVMEPALEYARDFTHALLDPVTPSALSLLSMIHLNDALFNSLTSITTLSGTPSLSSSATAPSTSPSTSPCPSLEPHLIATRMLLFPAFSKLMSAHVDSLRKINGSQGTSGGLGGMLGLGGGSAASVKDSQVDVVVRRYAEMFAATVALSEAAMGAQGSEREAQSQDDEMVFSSLLRIRQELDKLLLHQSSKIPDPAKQKAFLRAHYEELLQSLSAGLSRHPRSQAEVAHYREAIRKAT